MGYDYRCPKCKTSISLILTPAKQQTLCPKCKTRQMRDITPKYKFTNEFRFFEEIVKETERDLTWYLNDFEWKKEPYYPPQEPTTEEVEDDD